MVVVDAANAARGRATFVAGRRSLRVLFFWEEDFAGFGAFSRADVAALF